jgi:hypothetical protein
MGTHPRRLLTWGWRRWARLRQRAMARLLDRPDAVAQHPAAVGQLVKILDALRKRPARRGRLAAVRTMSRSSRGEEPDAG